MPCKILKNMQRMKAKNFTTTLLLFACLFFMSGFTNTDKIKLLKDAIVKVEQESNTILVSVKTSRYNKIDFYMFTIEGKLIKELSINGSKKFSITKLEKGIYMYECFSNDERLVNGSIELK
jgi:nitrous oxidase accessory protein NosD